jgi:hypothetical protein
VRHLHGGHRLVHDHAWPTEFRVEESLTPHAHSTRRPCHFDIDGHAGGAAQEGIVIDDVTLARSELLRAGAVWRHLQLLDWPVLNGARPRDGSAKGTFCMIVPAPEMKAIPWPERVVRKREPPPKNAPIDRTCAHSRYSDYLRPALRVIVNSRRPENLSAKNGRASHQPCTQDQFSEAQNKGHTLIRSSSSHWLSKTWRGLFTIFVPNLISGPVMAKYAPFAMVMPWCCARSTGTILDGVTGVAETCSGADVEFENCRRKLRYSNTSTDTGTQQRANLPPSESAAVQ